MTLLGHNGAGKSTLINYLIGLYTNESQHPFLSHFSKNFTPYKIKKIGYAPEAAYLDPALSAYDYMNLMAKLKNIEKIDINKELHQVKLDVDENLNIGKFSKGMKQRLLLALALLGEPELIILDEPTSGLDPYGQEVVENLIMDIKKTKKSEFLICTHSMELALQMKDEILILQEGKIVFRGYCETLEELEALMNKYRPERIQ